MQIRKITRFAIVLVLGLLLISSLQISAQSLINDAYAIELVYPDYLEDFIPPFPVNQAPNYQIVVAADQFVAELGYVRPQYNDMLVIFGETRESLYATINRYVDWEVDFDPNFVFTAFAYFRNGKGVIAVYNHHYESLSNEAKIGVLIHEFVHISQEMRSDLHLHRGYRNQLVEGEAYLVMGLANLQQQQVGHLDAGSLGQYYAQFQRQLLTQTNYGRHASPEQLDTLFSLYVLTNTPGGRERRLAAFHDFWTAENSPVAGPTFRDAFGQTLGRTILNFEDWLESNPAFQ